MFVKSLAFILVLEVCLGLTVEDPKRPVAVSVPVRVPPSYAQGVPPGQPSKPNSDLKTDPSTWWHSYYHHTYPVYYYNVQSPPTYTYWQTVY